MKLSTRRTHHTRAWFGDEAHGELVLEHDDGCAEGRSVRQQPKCQRAADLVRDVGNADIEVRQLHLRRCPTLLCRNTQNAYLHITEGTPHSKTSNTVQVSVQMQSLATCPAYSCCSFCQRDPDQGQ